MRLTTRVVCCFAALAGALSAPAMAQSAGTPAGKQVASCCTGKGARCTGSAYCSACTNCSRCAHCSAGGTCGVCAGTSAGRASSSGYGGSSGSGRRPTTPTAPRPRPTPKPKPTPAPAPRLPQEFTGRVVGVTDGDTLTVLTASKRQVKIRLNGVDAPEKAQAFGQAAKTALSNLAYDRMVTIRVKDTDRYGRTVADVSTGGVSLNQEMVKRGMAWWYQKYAPENTTLQLMEQEAREAKRGLWADAKPVAPWAWRNGAE